MFVLETLVLSETKEQRKVCSGKCQTRLLLFPYCKRTLNLFICPKTILAFISNKKPPIINHVNLFVWAITLNLQPTYTFSEKGPNIQWHRVRNGSNVTFEKIARDMAKEYAWPSHPK